MTEYHKLEILISYMDNEALRKLISTKKISLLERILKFEKEVKVINRFFI